MPIREYGCQNEDCGHTFEVIQAHCAEDPKQCPKCSEMSLVRLISNTSPPTFVGSGWYVNDYGKGKKPR